MCNEKFLPTNQRKYGCILSLVLPGCLYICFQFDYWSWSTDNAQGICKCGLVDCISSDRYFMPDEVSGGLSLPFQLLLLLLSLSLLWCYHNSIDYCLFYFSFAILPHPLPHISYYKTLKVIAHIKIKLPHDEADYFQLMLQNDTWYSDCSPLWSWAKQVALPKIIASNQGMYSI